MKTTRILVVEDEESILELIRYNLVGQGYEVVGVSTGELGLEKATNEEFGLILLDLMLPGIDGLEVCRRLKAVKKSTPVIIVSAKGEESDVVTGLETGADDYIHKPFSPKVLIARVQAVLRRSKFEKQNEKTKVDIHGIVIDPQKFLVTIDNKKISLTATEFHLLHHLAGHPGWVFTRSQIVDAVKGEDYAVTERSVDVQIVGLRKKLGEHSDHIETVRGVGYRFRE